MDITKLRISTSRAKFSLLDLPVRIQHIVRVPTPICAVYTPYVHRVPFSILLVPVWVVNELPMQLLCLLCVKLLPAFWTLEGASHLDTDVLDSTVAGLCRICDFQCLRHAYTSSWMDNPKEVWVQLER